MRIDVLRRQVAHALFGAVVVFLGAIGLSAPAAANPATDWRLDFIIVSVDPDAELELYNPQGDSEDRLVERVKGVVLNGLLDATNGFFSGARPVVLLAVVRRFDGLSSEATVLAGGEMRATIDVWFADAGTTEELTPVRTLDVTRITLGNIGGIFAHFIGGSQTTRFSRSVTNKAREWLAGLDTLATVGPELPETGPAAQAVAPETPLPVPRAVPEPAAEPLPEPEIEIAALPEPVPEPAARSPVGGIGPAALPEPVVIVTAPEPVAEPPADLVPEPGAAAEPAVAVAVAETLTEPATTPGPAPEAVPAPAAEPTPAAIAVLTPEVPEVPAPASTVPAVDPAARVTVVSPSEGGPTLASARWVGFSPAVYTGEAEAGLWIAGPFDRNQREGWITDTATGSTTRVSFIWRDPANGGTQAVLSREAAEALGLEPGQVANVAVYLPR